MKPKRACGACSLCCKLFAHEFSAANQWCPNYRKGKGCIVFETRPEFCRHFECLWLQGRIPEELSPRRTRVVAWQQSGTNEIYLEQDGPGLAEFHFRRLIENSVAAGFIVTAVYNGKGVRYGVGSSEDEFAAGSRGWGDGKEGRAREESQVLGRAGSEADGGRGHDPARG